jgi:hypothetical protein
MNTNCMFFMNLQRRKLIMLTAILVLSSLGSLFAQSNIANYLFSKTTETYTPIIGGDTFIAANVIYDQEISGPITIPAFNFGGVNVTKVFIHANGYITFDSLLAGTNYTPLSSTSNNVKGVICAFGADLGTNASSMTPGATSEIKYKQIGDEFVAQFSDVKRWISTLERISFQIRINSATGVIKIIYGGPIVIGSSTTALQVGIRGNSTTWADNVNNLTIDNIPSGTTCTWADAITASANSSTMYLSTTNANVIPIANMAYTWTPGTTLAPVRTFAAVTGITANGAVLTWTAPTGATQYNIQYRVPGTCTWTNFSGNPVAGTTATLTGLLQATSYQIRIQSVNANGNAIWSHIPNSAGTSNGYATSGTFTTLTSCGIPASVAVAATSIGSTTATATWTAPTVGPPTNYFWEVRTSGAAGSGATGLITSGTSSTASVNLTGLSSATAYTFYVRTNCSGTNSLWNTGVAFTTLCTTPAPGATIASVSNNLCLGTPVNFSVATATPGPGVTYQWQSSTDNVTYTNITGATAATYSGVATAIYYRNKVRCSAGPDSVVSVPVQLSFNNSVTNTVPGTRCGMGTAILSATGSAGTTVKWYAAATGGIPLVSGNSFTTPVINTTTSYYAGAESILTGQAIIGAGASTGSNYDAIFYHLYGGLQTQFLIRASELTANGVTPGNITSIGINMSTVTNTSYGGFAVSVGTTSNTDMSGGLFAGTLTPVFSATSYTPTTGNNTFAFTTPLIWDGTSNIIVKFCWSNNNSGGTDNFAKVDATGFTSCAYYRVDNQAATAICSAATGTGTTSNRPQFYINGQVICSSPRVMVAATVTAPPTFTITPNQTVCNNVANQLTVTSPATNYTNYTWSPVANLFTDAAATIPYTGTNASTVYFKNTVVGSSVFTVNANNTTSQCATLATDTIITLPGAVTAIAIPSSICVSGTAVLSLIPTANYGAAGFQWQSSSDNNTFVNVATNGNGSIYTTPTTTSTSYYRAIVKSSAGTTCLNSVSDTAKVYNPQVTGTTPAARCGAGTLTLGATGNDGTLKWYTAATGGTSVASGTSFITPPISATTTYYVASEASPSGSYGIGTGTTLTGNTSYPTAFGNRWYQDWSQMVYTAAELTAAGLGEGYISGIQLNIAALGSSATVSNYRISIGNTTNTTLSNFTTAVTSVYGPSTYTSAVGVNTITFTTPYYWDGTSNLILDIRGTGINSTYNATTYYTATTGNTVVSAYSSSNNTSYYTSNPTATTSTSRLNVIFAQTGCASPRTPVAATINQIPVAAVSPNGPVTICEGEAATLTASGGGNYQWRNTAGNINGQTSSTFAAGAAGTYRVVVSNPATGCVDTSVGVVVNTNVKPVVNLGNDTIFCSGPSLVLNAQNQGNTYLWDNFSTNQTRAVNATGSYSVKVTNGSNCSAYDTILVTVNPSPVVDLGNDTNLCVGTTYTLNAGNTGATYLWDNATTAQTRTINNTGTYFVKVTNAFNCAVSDTVHANYLAYPVVNLGNDIDACANVPVLLNAITPNATSYLWDNNSTQATRTVNGSGTYYVTVGNIANCKSTDTIQVTVHPNPVVNLGNDTVICHDIILTLDAQNIGSTYLWDDGTTERTRNVNATGNYHVTITNSNSCQASDAINVAVTAFPTADINAVHGDTATYTFNLLNTQNLTSYSWNFGDGSPLAVGTLVQHRYANNGQYVVSVLMHGVCNDSAVGSRTVEVYDAKGTTGIHEIEASKELKMYPNPATDNVLIENVTNYNLKQIAVYNVIGQKIYDRKADSKSKHNIDVSKFVSGIYTVRIETTEGTAVRKFEVLK